MESVIERVEGCQKLEIPQLGPNELLDNEITRIRHLARTLKRSGLITRGFYREAEAERFQIIANLFREKSKKQVCPCSC